MQFPSKFQHNSQTWKEQFSASYGKKTKCGVAKKFSIVKEVMGENIPILLLQSNSDKTSLYRYINRQVINRIELKTKK